MCIVLSQQPDFPLPAKRKNKKWALNNTVFRSRLVGPIKARIQARKPTLCVCVGLQVLGACSWLEAISTHRHTSKTVCFIKEELAFSVKCCCIVNECHYSFPFLSQKHLYSPLQDAYIIPGSSCWSEAGLCVW